jgi:hypothetical protein
MMTGNMRIVNFIKKAAWRWGGKRQQQPLFHWDREAK